MNKIIVATGEIDDELNFADAELRLRLEEIRNGDAVFYDLGEFQPYLSDVSDSGTVDSNKRLIEHSGKECTVASKKLNLNLKIKHNKLVQWAVVGSLLPIGGSGFQGLLAQTTDGARDASSRSWYIGGGLGVSMLEPDSFSSSLTIADDTDLSFNLYAGIDFSKRFGIEAQYARLGESGIAFLGDNVGNIDYQVAGVSGLLYLFDTSGMSGNRAVDGGLSFYLKAGGGALFNDSALDFVQNHDFQFWVGAGLQLGFDNGWAVRAEVNSFDTDARQVTASLVKRFSIGDPYGSPAPVPVADPVVTPVEQVVEPQPPALPELDLNTVYFGFDQSELDRKTRDELDEFVAQLAGHPDVQIVLTGHTDWIGSQNYNTVLSMSRAASVRDYLVAQSFDASRIEVEGLGELLPVADNQTESGRALNRRVDIALRLR